MESVRKAVSPRPRLDPGNPHVQALLLASQDGDAAAYGDVLTWVAGRARARCAQLSLPLAESRAVVDGVLHSVHIRRHTYAAHLDVERWADGVIEHAVHSVGQATLRKTARGGDAADATPRWSVWRACLRLLLLRSTAGVGPSPKYRREA